jgi:Na+/melibiose symporter-like transporter
MANFGGIFAASVVICALITFRSSDRYKVWRAGTNVGSNDSVVSEEVSQAHKKLLQKYIIVYLLATISDWLQGPFVYALYTDYGFKKIEIAQLFVAGFGSSMIFGSFVGGMADWGGRRTFVIIYALVYIASCVTKREFLGSRIHVSSQGFRSSLVLSRLQQF